MSEKKGAIKKSTLDAIGNAIRSKDGSTEPIPVNALADRITALPTPSGENKLAQIFNKTVTEITAEDLEGVTTIPDYTFRNCESLTSVVIPDSVISMGIHAFYNCSKLRKITLGSGVEEIGGSAFQFCYELESMNFPSSLKKIGGTVFDNCNALKYVFIEDLASWCQINRGTSKPQSYMISTPIQKAGNFYLKNALGEYEIPTSIAIPNEVQKIEMLSFYNADNLISVTIGGHVKTIGHYAFAYCNNLVTLNIENGVEIIEDLVFQGCKNLASITIPDSMTSIGKSVFDGCTSLTDIYINKPEGSISGSPWGATNATIHWNTPLPSEEV